MDQLLKSLQGRRAAIQSKIDDEQARPLPDSLHLSALKKLKLHVRDQIEFIERTDRNLAPLMVVRRRAWKPASMHGA